MGPLVKVDTITAGINLNINRILRLGPNSTLVFKTPQHGEDQGWKTIATVVKDFDRMSGDEFVNVDGKSIYFSIADTTPSYGEVDDSVTLPQILAMSQLYIDLGSNRYFVSKVTRPAVNEAQVYIISCQERTMKTSYFDND